VQHVQRDEGPAQRRGTLLRERRRRAAATLAPDVWETFTRYLWPGNVRELENTLERMIVAAGEDAILKREHMPEALRAIAARMRVQISARLDELRQPMPSPAEARAVLERKNFRHGQAAVELGISRHQLYRLLKRREAAEPSAGRAPA